MVEYNITWRSCN